MPQTLPIRIGAMLPTLCCLRSLSFEGAKDVATESVTRSCRNHVIIRKRGAMPRARVHRGVRGVGTGVSRGGCLSIIWSQSITRARFPITIAGHSSEHGRIDGEGS